MLQRLLTPVASVPLPIRLTLELVRGQTPSVGLFALELAPFKLLTRSLQFPFFAVDSMLAVYLHATFGDSDALLQLIFTQMLSINCTLDILLHFYSALYTFYTSMIFVPILAFWLYATSLVFLARGLMISFSKTMAIVGWILLAKLVLVSPKKVVSIFHTNPRNHFCKGFVMGAIMRTIYQFVFIQGRGVSHPGPSQ